MNWKLFMLAFTILFFAELGDKTQLAVFTLVSQYKEPLPIFLGSATALILVTLIGATFGKYVSYYVPAEYIQMASGLLFLLIGLLILREAIPSFIKHWIEFL